MNFRLRTQTILIVLQFFLLHYVSAQYTITGTISNDDGERLSYASVFLVNQDFATSTEDNGTFILEGVPAGDYILKASYVGYNSIETQIKLDGNLDLNLVMNGTIYELDKIEINATKANANSPITQTNMSRDEIQDANLGQDIPYVLKWMPSVTVSSDAGTGIGYTGMRVRGSDASRTNVTINGVPLNDSESQALFWVDLPDFLASVNDIQIQRGVGVSTNGTSAFGSTVHLNTQNTRIRPYASFNSSIGSFGTRKLSGNVGTGLMNSQYSLEGRYSTINSDGYIDRAAAAMTSFFISAAKVSERSSLRLNIMSGHEITYQAWNGLPIQFLETNRTYNTAGTDKQPVPYNNEVDNYRQTHTQLIYNRGITDDFKINLVGHYTRGFGFFENYKGNEFLHDFGYAFDSIPRDVIIARYLDNHFYGMVYSLELDKPTFDFILGGALNNYVGEHFGKGLWNSKNKDSDSEYYRNSANKQEFNVYGRLNYEGLGELIPFVDLQYRFVRYNYGGQTEDRFVDEETDILHFFNPKLGLTYLANKNQKLFAYLGVANREPSRDEYVESTPESRPSPEQLIDFELGYEVQYENFDAQWNFFNMQYKDQLVPTGQLNDVGAATRVNVEDSYRRGMEFGLSVRPLSFMQIQYSGTFSINKIVEFDEYIDNWETGGQDIVTHENTDIAFSPSVIQSVRVGFEKTFADKHNVHAMISQKYVGEQFLDNTGNPLSIMPAFQFTDLQLMYKLKVWRIKNIALTFQINNLFDNKYYNNAWIYRFNSPGYNPVPDDPYAQIESGDTYHLRGVYPQATRNFMLGLRIDL